LQVLQQKLKAVWEQMELSFWTYEDGEAQTNVLLIICIMWKKKIPTNVIAETTQTSNSSFLGNYNRLNIERCHLTIWISRCRFRIKAGLDAVEIFPFELIYCTACKRYCPQKGKRRQTRRIPSLAKGTMVLLTMNSFLARNY
jgi:hypothetical protein